MTMHSGYPHHPGTLPDCPACDMQLAQEAYLQASRGEVCPMEAMQMLDDRHRRLVENALAAEKIAQHHGIPVRDALHRMNITDGTKAKLAEWVCPESAADWQGSIEERGKARQASEDRDRERQNDRVLEAAAGVDPDDRSAEARQVREAAASVRDHRANHHNQIAWEERLKEREELALAWEAYALRDEYLETARAFQVVENWEAASIAALDAQREAKRGDELVACSISHKRVADENERKSDEYLAANRRHDDEMRGRR